MERHHYHFEGGPLDGASLDAGGGLLADEFLVSVPVALPGAAGGWTGRAVHRYVLHTSTAVEGSADVTHRVAHHSVEERREPPFDWREAFDRTEPAP